MAEYFDESSVNNGASNRPMARPLDALVHTIDSSVLLLRPNT